MTLEELLSQTYNRDGYKRERALTVLADNHLQAPCTLQVLLRLQNDYVPNIRKQAHEYLLTLIVGENLTQLLKNTHLFLHLQEQSRTDLNVINQLRALYVQDNNFTQVKSYVNKMQGQSVRAIYKLLTESSLGEVELLEIALSSPDIVVNMQVWKYVQGFRADK